MVKLVAVAKFEDINLKFCMPQEWYNISGTYRQFFDNFKIATFVYVQSQNVDISKF